MEITLIQGKVAHIDDVDWPLVAAHRWYAKLAAPNGQVLRGDERA